jgi:drug/metabolite transporter (DMT)-like permease
VKTKWWAILIVFLCTFFTSTAQLLWKIGSKDLSFNFLSLITNYYLFFGFFLYGIAALMLIISLKYGELSVIYPIVATSLIWVSLFSVFIIKENVNYLRWIGVGFIVLGLIFINQNSNTKVKYKKSVINGN